MSKYSYALTLSIIVLPMGAFAEDDRGRAACEDSVRLMQEQCKPTAPGPTRVTDCLRATTNVKYGCEAAGAAMSCRGANGRTQVWCNANNLPIGVGAANSARTCAEAKADVQSFCATGGQ
jgi:hypothetical protein